jgi:hypothetical protein
MSIYTCFNKPRPTPASTYVAQSGWSDTFRDGHGAPWRVPLYVDIGSAFDAAACQYSKQHGNDPECMGCVHRVKVA